MSIYEVNNTKIIENFFEDYNETFIWSCLEKSMGKAYVDNIINPKSVQVIVGDLCFFEGETNYELIKHKPINRKTNFIIMISRSCNWNKLIEDTYKEGCKKVTRYALKKEKDIFDTEKLKDIAKKLDKKFCLQKVNRDLYNQIIRNSWSHDLCSQFNDYEDYKKRGIGYIVTHNGIIVSGASSYTIYKEGIEIQIDTRNDYRRKGLASVCAAKLILECLEKGLYPSWDAQNKMSLSLALKLGYHFDKEYIAYEITNY